jgi:hypothetical protein
LKGTPYLTPDNDVDLNVALLLLIISTLEKSKNGKLLLTKEKILIFMYLIKNPVMLDRLLVQLKDTSLELSEAEFYSINSISINLDPLFDYQWIKSLIKICAIKNLISANYRKDEGFLYSLTVEGSELASRLEGNYFDGIKKYLKKIEVIKSESTTNLNRLLNDIFQNSNTAKQYSQYFN